MVSTAHPIATQAGLDILTKGGTAYDAAVAIAATLNVVEPQNSGMGGYGLILTYDAASGKTRVLNASGRIPESVDPDAFRPPTPNHIANRAGAKSAAPPVNARAWEQLHKYRGKLAWRDLFASAITAARDGFVLTDAISKEAFDAFPPHAREFYGSGGKPLDAGARLIQKDLAASLETVAREGPAAVHGGRIGQAIAAEMQRLGGFLTIDDLKQSRPEWYEPIEFTYRGHRVLTAPPPANSFTALIRLGIMEQFDARALGHNTAAYLHHFAETTKHGEWCRVAHAADPDVAKTPLGKLLSPAYLKQEAARVGATAAPFSPPGPTGAEGLETTHFVAADAAGNMVTATQTIGQGFGSRVMAPGTGIWLNNSLYYSTFEPKGNPMDVHPGRRKLNSNAPVFVMRNGRPWIATGAAGGHTIPQTVPQVILNMVDFQMDIQQALAAPRIAFVAPNELSVESAIPENIRAALAQRGHLVRAAPSIGRLHGVSIEYAGGKPVRFHGGFDPRGKGLAKGID
jgi:gamma-glutamyltranspeptidase/glutathione hydrolase